MSIAEADLNLGEDIHQPSYVIDQQAVEALGTASMHVGHVLVGSVEIGSANWDLGRAVCGLIDKLGTDAQIICAPVPGKPVEIVGIWVTRREE